MGGIFALPSLVKAQATAVVVVINNNSVASRQIGEYYAAKRAVPDRNLIRVTTSTDETIARSEFRDSIEGPIAQALTERKLLDQALYLVVTKGVPLRIHGTSGPRGTASSVDSELSLLYRRLTGRTETTIGKIDNPYYLKGISSPTAPTFRRVDQDIYLVTRLDGFDIDDVIGLIDRGLSPSTKGDIILDTRGGSAGAGGDAWLAETAATLKAMPERPHVDIGESPTVGDNTDVLGYFSWGSNDPQPQKRRRGLRFSRGAVAGTFAGADARTMTAPPANWTPGNRADRRAWFAGGSESLIGDLIHEGVTGVAGNVADPEMSSVVRPQLLFPAYLSGFNLAEAFYLAMPHLSWQGIVIGDPLCRPFTSQSPTPPPTPPVDDRLDERTGLPLLFSHRRLDAARKSMPGASEDTVAMLVRAESEIRLGRRDQARGMLETVVKVAPDLTSPQLLLAELYETSKAFPQVIDTYRSILKLEPRNVTALNNLAYALATRANAPGEALPLAQRAAALAPRNANALDTYGWILHLTGSEREAARYLSQAVALDPDSAETRFHAAVVALALGDGTAAQIHLNEVIRLDPTLANRADVADLRVRLQKR